MRFLERALNGFLSGFLGLGFKALRLSFQGSCMKGLNPKP